MNAAVALWQSLKADTAYWLIQRVKVSNLIAKEYGYGAIGSVFFSSLKPSK